MIIKYAKLLNSSLKKGYFHKQTRTRIFMSKSGILGDAHFAALSLHFCDRLLATIIASLGGRSFDIPILWYYDDLWFIAPSNASSAALKLFEGFRSTLWLITRQGKSIFGNAPDVLAIPGGLHSLANYCQLPLSLHSEKTQKWAIFIIHIWRIGGSAHPTWKIGGKSCCDQFQVFARCPRCATQPPYAELRSGGYFDALHPRTIWALKWSVWVSNSLSKRNIWLANGQIGVLIYRCIMLAFTANKTARYRRVIRASIFRNSARVNTSPIAAWGDFNDAFADSCSLEAPLQISDVLIGTSLSTR